MAEPTERLTILAASPGIPTTRFNPSFSFSIAIFRSLEKMMCDNAGHTPARFRLKLCN